MISSIFWLLILVPWLKSIIFTFYCDWIGIHPKVESPENLTRRYQCQVEIHSWFHPGFCRLDWFTQRSPVIFVDFLKSSVWHTFWRPVHEKKKYGKKKTAPGADPQVVVSDVNTYHASKLSSKEWSEVGPFVVFGPTERCLKTWCPLIFKDNIRDLTELPYGASSRTGF